MRAVWKDTVVVESYDNGVVEGSHYFPRDSVRREYLRKAAPKRRAGGRVS